MNIRNVLILIGIIAVLILLARYVSQFRRMRSGNRYVSGGRVFLNWLLLLVIVVSLGGAAYANHHGQKQEKADQVTAPAPSSSTSSEDDRLYISYDKDKARLNDQGIAPMKFVVSPDTKVQIKGEQTGTVYKTFKTKKGKGPVTIHYQFEYAAKYEVIATKKGKRIVKHLTIKDQESESSSSSSVSSSSSSSSSSSISSSSSSTASSSSSSSTANSSDSGTNDGNDSSATTGQSSYGGSSAGNSARRSYTPRHSTNTNRATTPAAPAVPSGTYVSNQPVY